MIDDFSAYQRVCSYSEATILRRRKALTMFLRHIAPGDFATATVGDIEGWLATKNKATTRYTYLADLRAFYRWAVKRQHLEIDPAAEVDPVRKPRSLPKPLGSEVRRAVELGRLRTRRMAALGLFAGLRCAEIAALTGEDIDRERGVITVRGGKGSKDRVIPLHPELAAILDGVPMSGRVFTWNGAEIHGSTVSRTLREHLKRVGVGGTAHQLRHTFGTEAARATGGNLSKVGKWMGHVSTDTTKGYDGWAGLGADDIARMFTENVA